MIKLFIRLCIYCYSLLLFSGCAPDKKEMPCVTSYTQEDYLIRQDEKYKQVYKGSDTISFMLNNTKILTFNTKGIDTAFSGTISFGECYEATERYENYIARFTCTDSVISFPLTVTLCVTDETKPYSVLEIKYRKTFSDKGQLTTLLDSLVVRGKTYYDVMKIYEQTDTLGIDEHTVIYYNIPYGIIRMKLLEDQFDLMP